MNRNCGCHSHNGFQFGPQLEIEAQIARAEAEGLTPDEIGVSLDLLVSMSASGSPILHWDPALIEDQYRRFQYGS